MCKFHIITDNRFTFDLYLICRGRLRSAWCCVVVISNWKPLSAASISRLNMSCIESAVVDYLQMNELRMLLSKPAGPKVMQLLREWSSVAGQLNQPPE